MQEAAPRGKGGFLMMAPQDGQGYVPCVAVSSGPGGGRAPIERLARTYDRFGFPLMLGLGPRCRHGGYRQASHAT